MAVTRCGFALFLSFRSHHLSCGTKPRETWSVNDQDMPFGKKGLSVLFPLSYLAKVIDSDHCLVYLNKALWSNVQRVYIYHNITDRKGPQMTKNHPRTPIRCKVDDLSCRVGSQKCPADMRPLSRACRRGKVRVCKVCGDRKNCARMANLGLLPGTELELLCPRRGRQCMVRLNGGTLSLDEPTADNIYVTTIE